MHQKTFNRNFKNQVWKCIFPQKNAKKSKYCMFNFDFGKTRQNDFDLFTFKVKLWYQRNDLLKKLNQKFYIGHLKSSTKVRENEIRLGSLRSRFRVGLSGELSDFGLMILVDSLLFFSKVLYCLCLERIYHWSYN